MKAAAQKNSETTKNKRANRKVIRVVPKKSAQLPATKLMLDKTRAELKSNITSLRLEMREGFKKIDARFKRIEARFKEVDARFKDVDARFKDVDARFDKVDASISELKSMVHRVMVLVEEQNARNIFVLDGYASLDQRMSRIEKSTTEV